MKKFKTSHKFKKNFGQNFLKTKRFAKIMVNSLNLKPDEVVIEIGPGDGIVTNLLLETGARVISIEIDYSLLTNLIKRFSDNPKYKLINQDILKSNINQIVNEFAPDAKSYKVVGSLPFNISKKIINLYYHEKTRSFNDSSIRNPTVMSFILQEEVSKNYNAKAPDNTFISAYSQLFCNIRKLESIPASQFFPEPKVNAAISTFEFLSDLSADVENLAKFVRIGFKSPRKTLSNNLRSTYKDIDFLSIFEKIKIKPTARASEIEMSQWKELYSSLKDSK